LAIVNISYCVQQHRGHKLLRKVGKVGEDPTGKEGKGETTGETTGKGKFPKAHFEEIKCPED